MAMEYEQGNDSSMMMWVLGVVVLIALVLAFWIWGLPALRTERVEETVIDVTQEVIEVTPTASEEVMEKEPTPTGSSIDVNLQY